MKSQKHLPDSPGSFGGFRFCKKRGGGLIGIPSSSLERGYLIQNKECGSFAILRVRREPVGRSGKFPPSEIWRGIERMSGKGLPKGFTPILETGEDDGLPYYVSAVPWGEPLRDYLRRVGPIPENEALKLVSEFVTVLDSQDHFKPEDIAVSPESIWMIKSPHEGVPPRLGLGEYSFLSKSRSEQKSVDGSCALLLSLFEGDWWDDRIPDPVRRLSERPEIPLLVIPADGSPLGWKDWKRQLESLAARSFGAPARPIPEVSSFVEELRKSAAKEGDDCNVIAKAFQDAPVPESKRGGTGIRWVAALIALLAAVGFLCKSTDSSRVSRSTAGSGFDDLIPGLTLDEISLSGPKDGVAALLVEAPTSWNSIVSLPDVEDSLIRNQSRMREAMIRVDVNELSSLGPSVKSFPETGISTVSQMPQEELETPANLRERAKSILAKNPDDGSEREAMELLGEASAKGDVEAQYLLGEALIFGRVIEKDRGKGVIELRRAASQDDPRAADLLGVCYMRGWGVAVDHEKAVEYFSRAVSLGHPASHYNLGARYAQGQGVKKDPEKAASIFRIGAEMGDSISMMLYGRCYETGFGVRSSENKAKYWHKKSALSGNREAAEWCRKNGVSLASNH